MASSHFSFKQFDILQDECAMKVGTDSVLLGAWATIPATGKILDIGAGTGILSLMAAQRSISAHITGIEIDSSAAHQADMNVGNSLWKNRITIIHDNFAHYASTCQYSYDAILSNPPYFISSLHSPIAARTTARHTESLDYNTIFDLSRQLITAQGTLSLVIPADMYAHVNGVAQIYGWGASRIAHICTTIRKTPKRVLCEWQRNHYKAATEGTICIRDTSGEYTTQYISLTKDFYLNF